jgi:hypothetical protein
MTQYTCSLTCIFMHPVKKEFLICANISLKS